MALFDEIGETLLRRQEGGRDIALSLADGARTLRQRFRHLFGRLQRGVAAAAHNQEEPGADDPTRLAGPSFAAQEPDLAKEAGPNGRQISGWAMGDPGQPG